MGSYYFCNSKIRNLEQDYAIRTADYAYAKKELSDLETQLARGGTICNDGWKSNSSGQGTCSYHGGVNQDIDEIDIKHYHLLLGDMRQMSNLI